MWDEFVKNLKEHGYAEVVKEMFKEIRHGKRQIIFATNTHHVSIENIPGIGYFAHIWEFATGKNEYFTNGQYDSCIFSR